MEKIKKWIIILAIIIVLLIIAMIFIASISHKSNTEDPEEAIGEAEESVDIANNIVQVEDNNTFYSIEKNLQNYYLYLKVGNQQAIYELITEEYINENAITQENVLNYFPKIEDEDYEFLLKQLYLNDSNLYPVYYAYGELLQNNGKEDSYFTIYTDQTNLCWAVEPINKQEYEDLIKANKNNQEKKITKKQYNQLKSISVNNEDIAKKYFKNYVYNALHDVEEAYTSLNEEYRVVKYSDLEVYRQYIQAKQAELVSMDVYSIKKLEDFANEDEYIKYIANLEQKGLNQYAVTQEADYTQYVCIDDYGNYYIFRETAPMQYTVILDTYTIDLPEFTEKYANSTEEEKVLLNIQKFFEAINQADYQYAYNKLDETFKANNFKTLADFENYVKANFFIQNKLAAGKAEKQGDIYLYNVTISDASGEDDKTVTTSFVMQLQEGTDFVMSFGVE